MVSGLNYTVLIIILVCADDGLQGTCGGGFSVSAIFCSKFQRILSSPTIPTVLTSRSSPHLSAFRCTKRMLSEKERVESEVLAWRRALYCKEKNAAIEKAHRKELHG